MPNVVSKWIHRKFSERKGRQAIPFLPDERPRPVTPLSCHRSGSSTPGPAFTTGNGPFFQKLPPEIRHQILVEAFGDRVVHMDLMYDHPILPRRDHASMPSDAEDRHCGLNVEYDARIGRVIPKVNRSKPKQWIWRSSVCHRDYPGSFLRLPGHRVQPCEDMCRYGDSIYNTCGVWPGESPTKCFIGAMGWMLSCRQAYLEGTEILYSTNTIHTSSKEMVMNLPRLLLPQRLLAINTLEIVWEFVPFPRQGDMHPISPMGDLASFHAFMEAAPAMFGHVRSLYISLQGQLKPRWSDFSIWGDEWFKFTEVVIMAPVDEMVRKLGPQVKECSIALPSSLYASRRNRTRQAGGLVQQTIDGGQLERYWRPLDRCKSRSGYWVRLGQKDLTLPRQACLGFIDDLASDEEDWVLYGNEWRTSRDQRF